MLTTFYKVTSREYFHIEYDFLKQFITGGI